MKNYFVSTLTAIALALTLGIGGFTLTAPVTATDANAVSIGHHFNTCSRHVITKCDGAIRTAILFDRGYNAIFNSAGFLQYGSSGRDQAAYGALEYMYRHNVRGRGQDALRFLRQYFSDEDVRAYNNWLVDEGRSNVRFAYPWGHNRDRFGNRDANNTGHISPQWRERVEPSLAVYRAELDRRAEQAAARAEELRIFNILNSRDERRIVRHYCDQAGEGNSSYQYRDSGDGYSNGICLRFGSGRNVEIWNKYFHDPNVGNRRASQYNGRLKPEYRNQYRVGVPLSNLLNRFRRDCEYHNGEFKPATENNEATCGVIIGQTEDGSQNRYKVTEYTGWDHTRPSVYTRRLAEARVPVDVSYTDYEDDGTTGLQVTQISPVTLADLNSDADPVASTRGVVVENRETIIDLVDNVNANENRLFALEPLVEANSLVIENLGDSLATLADEVASVQENVEENRAGVAVALAIPRSGLQNEERFRLSAAIGNFKGESALGVALEFRISPPVSFSVGGGFSQQGSSGARAEISYGW